jgi:hypothetical protein
MTFFPFVAGCCSEANFPKSSCCFGQPSSMIQLPAGHGTPRDGFSKWED